MWVNIKKTTLLLKYVEQSKFGSMPAWELLVLAIVVSATLSIGSSPAQSATNELEIAEISGTMTLTSRASMDAFGLQDFKIGPLATVKLTVVPIQSIDCIKCTNEPTGFHIEGAVTITELIDDAGRLGRVEGTLNATYLREMSDSSHVVREWFTVDWDAGPASSHWVVMLHHEPAKWLPSEEHSSTFLTSAFGFESRTGPFTSTSSFTDAERDIEGCLPGGFTCSKATQRDYAFAATFVEPRPPVTHAVPDTWQSVNSSPATNGSPEGMESLRGILSLDQSVSVTEVWTPMIESDLHSIAAWEINTSNSPNFAPLTSFFMAIGLSPIVFDVPQGTWNEAEFNDFQTGYVLDEEQNLALAILRLP
tara:strand:+ start:2950 stop:4041 length:1092 start_codon:yes stop_codon:yes gene_type:complete